MTTNPTDNTIDSELDDEIMDLFMEASINAITPKQYTDGIKHLIAQEANKTVVAELEAVLANCPMPTLSYEDIEHRLDERDSLDYEVIRKGP